MMSMCTPACPSTLRPGRIRFAGAGVLLVAGAAWAQPNLVANGSFEAPVVSTPFLRIFAPSSVITGWQITQGSVDLTSSLQWQQVHGNNSLDLDGAGGILGGIISTTLQTTPGVCYEVHFALSGNPGAGPTLKPMELSAAGQSQVFTFDITGRSYQNMGWRPESWQFVANAATTTLAFRSLTNPVGFGAAVDDVRVFRLLAADFNGDGVVNSTDVSDFINAWFADQAEGTLVTDWDGNGVVNSTDVSQFINSWFEDLGQACG